jgi:hypothetical protein
LPYCGRKSLCVSEVAGRKAPFDIRVCPNRPRPGYSR